MPRNPKRRGTNASQSFRAAEVEAAAALFETLRRGGDPAVLLRHPELARFEGKVMRMRRSLREERSGK